MDYEVFKAIVADGGGFDKISMLVFDNSIMPYNGFRESDFVQLGGSWVYKEPVLLRNKKDHEYTEKGFNYHPMECLQSVIMMEDLGNVAQEDIMSIMHGYS